ncbi:MAG: 4Fe-4S binding protein [Deltaproteobacteria bacterium]|nr:4Fe-4S binding protein [Deltaproteobacteria bacterium]
MAIRVNREKCRGCGNCVFACLEDAIEIIDQKAHIKEEGCTLCGDCYEACTSDAIEMEAS